MTTEPPRWLTSSYSNNGGACVQVAADLAAHGTVPVRDSKNPAGPVLDLTTEAFSAFVTGIKSGDLGTA
ncbi:DUF397 domain-containing protein [Streptomyces sp. NPDC006784]|uniref:DUF397 domain-containing protein n=1 Tax=Streptomyces sp. NPDC006784 TaxID=3364764 RepID=UPI0036C8D67F